MLAATALALALGLGQPAAADDPAAKAAAGSSFIFLQACLLRASVNQTPAAYASGSDELGRGVLADTPALKGLVALDGADGSGCRVRYAGVHADEAWSGFSSAFAKLTQAQPGACTPTAPATATRLSAACLTTGDPADPQSATRRFDVTFERTPSAAGGDVTATLTHLRP